jgi:hypothetical protein
MTYTINGKPYTESDINLTIAEINILSLDMGESMDRVVASHMRRNPPNYCGSPIDTDAIIDKCWIGLMSHMNVQGSGTRIHWDNIRWERLMKKHNCTKLIAACICLIEMEGEHERQ